MYGCDSSMWGLLRCRWYGIPSYYVQKLYSAAQGVSYVQTTAQSDTSFIHNEWAAASATCQDNKCSQLALKASQFLLQGYTPSACGYEVLLVVHSSCSWAKFWPGTLSFHS